MLSTVSRRSVPVVMRVGPWLAGLALVVSGCHRSPAPGKEVAPAAASAAHVETVVAAASEVPRYVFVTGSLAPEQQADVAAGTPGRVVRTFVERGTTVSAGALLAELDRRTSSATALETGAQARLAATQLRIAEDECRRTKMLIDSKAISQAEADRQDGQCAAARDALAGADARRQLAGVALNDSAVRAPFSGVVAERYVSAGEYVAASGRVAAVMAIDSLRVELTLPESAVTEVHEGTALEFAVSGDEGFPRRALVRYVGPAVRRSARDQVVEAIIDNRDHRLRPGLFAIARIAVGVTKLPTVPRGAVLAGDGVERVLVVDRGVVTRRVVAVEGLSSSDSVAVTSGLNAGERVVSTYSDALQDGALVD